MPLYPLYPPSPLPGAALLPASASPSHSSSDSGALWCPRFSQTLRGQTNWLSARQNPLLSALLPPYLPGSGFVPVSHQYSGVPCRGFAVHQSPCPMPPHQSDEGISACYGWLDAYSPRVGGSGTYIGRCFSAVCV